jgi:beta-glucosidase
LLTLFSNYKQIPQLVKDGRLDMKTVDTAVSRFLRAKFEMGLFENPYPASVADQTWSSLIHTSDAVQLAHNLDRESIILLENNNNTLPLKKSGSIAVIGPMAHGFVNVSQFAYLGFIASIRTTDLCVLTVLNMLVRRLRRQREYGPRR